MRTTRLLLIGLGAALWLPLAAHAADNVEGPAKPEANTSEEQQAAAPKCLEAAVNPVSGAPVDPPPAEALNKPCRPRAHDDDPFTVYERYSACD